MILTKTITYENTILNVEQDNPSVGITEAEKEIEIRWVAICPWCNENNKISKYDILDKNGYSEMKTCTNCSNKFKYKKNE